MALDPDIHEAVFKHVVAAKRLRFDREIDRHKGFFAAQRTLALFDKKRSFFGGAVGEDRLKVRVVAELDALDAYLDEKVGTPTKPGPLLDSVETKMLEHLDLADMGRVFASEDATTVAEARRRRGQRTPGTKGEANRRAWDYVKLRHQRCHAIVWRAAALHPELWKDFSDELDAGLAGDGIPMDEILDRRLRVVERMNFQIASRRSMGARTMDMSRGPLGPWPDGLRLRMFEYPTLKKTDEAVAALGSIAAPDQHYEGPEWRLDYGGGSLHYNVRPGTRVVEEIDDSFPPDPLDEEHYGRDLKPNGITAATAMERLFEPSSDFWRRTWWFCDHVIAALQIEALRFASARRTNEDDDFNDLVRLNPGKFKITATVGKGHPRDQGFLMAVGGDPYFDNTTITLPQLEVGDQLIFWNSILYPLVSSEAWSLENAVVTDLRSTPFPAGVDAGKTKVQGHGTPARSITGYSEILKTELQHSLKAVWAYVETNDGPGVVELPWVDFLHPLVKWSPFPDDVWRAPGPWWVCVDPREHETVAEALAMLPNCVKHDPSRGGGYVGPPLEGELFFPLYVPQLKGGWNAYLERREAGRIRGLSRTLARIRITREMVPGLHYDLKRGSAFAVVRPKVRP
jgi:hypothetical protein